MNKLNHCVKKLIAILFVICITLNNAIVTKAEGTVNMKRIYAFMPDITVEIAGTEVSGEDVSAKLGNSSLTLNSCEKYDSSQHSERIICLIDNSKYNTNLDAIKDSFSEMVNDLGSNTDLIVYTYSDQKEKIADGTENKKDIIKKVENIQNSQSSSSLYDTISSIYQEYYNVECAYDRQYIMLFTALSKQSVGASTPKEALNSILDKSLPVYTCVYGYQTEDAINTISAFSRNTGGDAYTLENKSMKKVKQSIDDVTILKFSAATNKANNKKRLLSIYLGSQTVSENTRIINSKADTTIPAVTKITADKAQNALIVSFSEDVLNADNIYNYAVTDADNNQLKITSAEYDKSSLKTYLYVEGELYNGDYTVEISGITDNSQNLNQLEYKETVSLNNTYDKKNFFEKYWWIMLLALLALIAVVVGMILITKASKKRRAQSSEKFDEISKKIDNNQENIVREVGNIYKNIPQKPQDKLRMKSGQGKKLTLRVNMKNRLEQRIELVIVSSIIVGRSAECDLSLEDTNLSRQHFAIEDYQGQLVVTDLNSSNGTFLNGNKVLGRQVLKANDKITAGSTDFILYM